MKSCEQDNNFFHMLLFLSSTEVLFDISVVLLSVVLNISLSHANTNLPNRRFTHEQFLIPKYLSILHVLLHS